MVIGIGVSRKGTLVSAIAANLLALSLPAHPSLADSPARGQPQEVGSKSTGTSSERSGLAKTPARKPSRRSDGSGRFLYEIVNSIRTRSEELCARYGRPADCLQEAEVCPTMRDTEDNPVNRGLVTMAYIDHTMDHAVSGPVRSAGDTVEDGTS